MCIMKESKLHIVGLEALDEQCLQLASGDPENPDYVNKAWFFMYCYKVLLCPKRYSHDWGACPYAHTNESARRRDPQRYNYSSCICPNNDKGGCPHGMECRYAHTLFEYYLHPMRFRTQMCKAGASCKRALCFFAHSQAELRHPERLANLGQSSAVHLASAAAAMAGNPADGGSQVVPSGPCALQMPLLPLPSSGTNLTLLNVGFDSSASNVSSATCQQGSSPTSIRDYASDLCTERTRSMGVVTSLPVGPTPVTSGLLQQTNMLSAVLAPSRLQDSSLAVTGVSSGLVSSMPQLQELLHRQQQQQQQQQLVASMTAMSLAHAPVRVEPQQLQLQQGALISSLAGAPAGPAALACAARPAAAVPLASSALQGAGGILPGYVQMVPSCAALLQAPGLSAAGLPLQQVYQPGAGYQLPAGNLQYAWL